MFEIIKNYPGDFPALTQPQPDAATLEAQIDAAISSADCVGMIIDSGVCTLQFDVEPSAGDLTLIDQVVAAHTGEPYVMTVQKLFSEAVQTEAGTTYAEKAALQSGILAGGDYLISWYAELATLTTDTTSGVLARILWDGTERAESSNNRAFYASFSGSVVITASQLTAPVLSVELKRVGTANTAQIRRIRLSITPLPQSG